jgi:hypothetical protein
MMRHYLNISATVEIYGENFEIGRIFHLKKTLKGFCRLLEHFVLLSIPLVGNKKSPKRQNQSNLVTQSHGSLSIGIAGLPKS